MHADPASFMLNPSLLLLLLLLRLLPSPPFSALRHCHRGRTNAGALGPVHELTPVYPPDAVGPPGDQGGVPAFFLQFAAVGDAPFRLDLMQVHWTNLTSAAAAYL